MITHNCSECIYKYEPTSIRDYYLKSLTMPSMKHWGERQFKHIYWLCTNPTVSKVDHVEEHAICKPCISYNFDGNCTYFKTSNAIDIIPSTSEIKLTKIIEDDVSTQSDDETTEDEITEDTSEDTTEDPIYVGDKIELSIEMTPAVIPAVTEEQEVTKQKKNEDENPLYDEETGEPVMETVTETVTIEEEHDNDQAINYKYQWYKNGRKLFQSKTAILNVSTKEESVDEYYCVITQSIENNGDGGLKQIETKSDSIIVTVEAKPEDPSDDTPDAPSGDDTPSDDTTDTSDDTPSGDGE